MSSRSDIVNDRLIYTCNCGWIDLNHMEDPSTRAYVGAKNLWKQLDENERAATNTGSCISPMRAAIYYYSVTELAKFPDGNLGYKVTYKQDMGNKYIKTDITRSYLVKYGLTLEQKKSVALSIFMEVSKLFEDHQDSFPWSLITNSGFSAEDLVSDLLGFYIAISEYSKESVLKLCHPVTKQTSLKIWDRDGAIGDIKNKTFEPAFSSDTSNPYNTDKACYVNDNCTGEKKEFPTEFKKITPATKGIHYIDFPKFNPSSCYGILGRSHKTPIHGLL